MKTAIILHGMPSKEEFLDPNIPAQSNLHWLPWIQKQLSLDGIVAQTPELPEPFEPNYEKWRLVFEQFRIDEQTILIGHSCGAGFLVRWLSENNVKVDKVVLVAPFIDPDGDEVPPGFFPFQIDPELIKKTRDCTILVAENDDQEIQDSVNMIAKSTNVKVKRLSKGGHFTQADLGTEKFPELLTFLISK